MSKRCIILSQGPVPTPEHKKVEGGGLRCWGLAKGMLANDPSLEITVAYHESYTQDVFTDNFEGISIKTWDLGNIAELVVGYDTVIVSYCMSELSVKTADAMRPDQQLILDCYVPIYVEASARDTDNLDREYYAFHGEVGRLAHVLKRGDIFLVANEPQRKFYRGVLAAVGRINPATYGQNLIQVVPYGIYREEPKATEQPITKLMSKGSKEKKILWFGGIYPWFDLRGLVDAVGILNEKVPAKLIIVGAKNPFNNHPDFTRPYDQLIEHIETTSSQDRVIVQDWVEFDKRADWYLDSDAVVVINKEGEENELSWRTRLVDFLWADLPLLTNGGDPLGEILIQKQAAQKLTGLTPKEIAHDLQTMLKDDKHLLKLKENLSELRSDYYWDTLTADLVNAVNTHKRAKDLQHFGDQTILPPAPGGRRSKLKKAVVKGKMLPAYARKHGLRSTYHVVRTIADNQFKRVSVGRRTQPGIVMVSHQLDLSGAPYVFIDLAQAIKEGSGNVPLEFHTFNPIHKDNIVRLNKLNIRPKIHLSKEIGLDLVQGDTVVLNTVAHSGLMKESVYAGLENGTVKRLVWFIHEDEPELLFDKGEARRISTLLQKDKIIMFIAAEKAMKNYQKYFEQTKNIRLQPYKYVIPKKFQKMRSEDDFKTIKFILTGNVADGRKGQLPILYAFRAFIDQYHAKNPKAYRDFELTYVGLSRDFISKQILDHADKLLGKRFKHYGQVAHDRSSELMMQSNVTICYSLRECLPLFVFEGMAAGHPVLRNDSSGMVEQLYPGKNGFYLDSADYNQIVDTLEEILNKTKTTNKHLAEMSKYSNKISLNQANNTYQPMIDVILK